MESPSATLSNNVVEDTKVFTHRLWLAGLGVYARIERSITEQTELFLHRFGLPSNKDVEQLNERVDDLNQAIIRLNAKLKR